ncbi:2-amino-4-hydroxy-6-hydroxymethyldihydropteridine pyrophosphokinase [Caldanaerobacter subterraneus subsp. yonseiensis KB-1]|uniref:2-amino-4-hydroxy-6-hydroxymethyldihydropteridine diphosphokinase n=1 Tax=Caldanaerobacter subterraneus subsp. yonseiensis KB-1 TaxID=1388761 RepID=U5CTV2_CALSX|nr:2-amino-4-hydroxy-6-hydroxymethyldihydropteridine diphosphokinase [Caldanaerobacter subterraneus]ERM93363.1 2-amino-4-hydroxy-6-hydroxymethyldihydropteridine pyrophosphokinase [Caldanaerobacter subterraneus subsp. yonseiensis KB-1]
MTEVYLSLGSNLGDREKYLKEAVKRLKSNKNIVLKKLSPIYETKPVGYLEQDNFLNAVILIETDLTPYELLDVTTSIEAELKRERTIKWGPRTIDIDILLYDGLILNDEKLTIPHPHMWERAFVLIPLRDINPSLSKNGLSIDELIQGLIDKQGVWLYKKDWCEEV